MKYEILKSEQDASVNFVFTNDAGKVFEARYVRRPGTNYIIVYLSSFAGCAQACRFCHLTQQGQTDETPATLAEIFEQADTVLNYYRLLSETRADQIHFNFMARGEPLLNPVMFDSDLYSSLVKSAEPSFKARNVSFRISTIMPKGVTNDKIITLSKLHTYMEASIYIYYSIYSMNDEWKKRWLPKAMPTQEALGMLADHLLCHYRWHLPFIAGENDSAADVVSLLANLFRYEDVEQVNIIRYNPPNDKSKESPDVERIFQSIKEAVTVVGGKYPVVKLIPRVGKDVAASCGCFIDTTPVYEDCMCIACSKKRASDPNASLVKGFRFACEICGNKRCPHHSDHELACTGSNEPGQKGSIY